MLGTGFVGVQELHLGGGKDAIKGSRRALGDGERACGVEAAGQLVEVDALMVEEEVQVPANAVAEVDGDGRAAAEVGVWRERPARSRPMSPPCRAGGSRGRGQRASGAFLARLRARARWAGSSPRVAAACSHALAGRFRLPQARPSGSKDVISRRAINGAEARDVELGRSDVPEEMEQVRRHPAGVRYFDGGVAAVPGRSSGRARATSVSRRAPGTPSPRVARPRASICVRLVDRGLQT